MFRHQKKPLLAACAVVAFPLLVHLAAAQTMTAPDISREPTLYVVPYAHLDTQWRWEFPQTISEYLLKTMRVNFDYMDKYPHYVFNWSGSNRYRLMKEYYPADYARLKGYVAKGRWFPAGSSVEEGDVNLPSAESIFRQVLYGNTFYRSEFGKASAEYMLPDCFGFPASLPTILAASGIKGFSTQKLSAAWQPAPKIGGPDSVEKTPEGIPFNVGVWIGPDGERILAALNPGNYESRITSDLSKTPPPPPPVGSAPGSRRAPATDWPARIDIDGQATGVFADYHYIGTGDIGGATNEESVKLLEAIVTGGEAVLPTTPTPAPGGSTGDIVTTGTPVRMGDGPVKVVSATADQMFLDIQPQMQGRMPTFQGDLELINHSAGSLTSQAYHKRWNRRNELLADAAEKASVGAAWTGGRPYPQLQLNNAWTLVMGGQFHDTGAGTATPRAYEFAQNDDLIAANQFADVLTSATESIAASLDTRAKGTPVLVYNPLNIAREDIVEAALPGAVSHDVAVFGPDGKQVPAQVENGKVVFLASVPSVGYAVYDVRPGGRTEASNELRVTPTSLENARYKVTLNAAGDVGSILDKSLGKELLASPMRLAISTDAPKQWPAWNMDFDQEQAPPRAWVGGTGKARIVENGPARIAVQVMRQGEGSTFVQTVRLSAGDAGNRIEFGESVDWRSLAANLKAVFPLTAANPLATYNWEVGTIQRPVAFDRQFEVASHHWIDQTDTSGTFGATILTDVKNGSDKRDNSTVRLTLLRSPGEASQMKGAYTDQLNQDWGHHEILFGLAGHAGDWRQTHTDWQAYRLSTPLIAFTTEKHAGPLGRTYSLVHIDNPDIRVLALKKAELSDEIILRLVELEGKSADGVTVHFAGPLAAAREVNGQELPMDSAGGPVQVVGGALQASFKPYQPRTFALKLGASNVHQAAIASQPVTLAYNLAVSSNDDTASAGGFNRQGDALPAEMLPAELTLDGVRFSLAPAGTGKPDAVAANGQSIELPTGKFNKVYLLAASADGDQRATFGTGSTPHTLTIEDWGGFIGQWDTRIWKPEPAFVTEGGGGTAPHTVALRKDFAVSASHQPWDLKSAGSPDWAPSYPGDYLGLRPGYIKPATLAWYTSHHHNAAGLNVPYQYSYLFVYALDLPAKASTLTLPVNPALRIMAISVASQEPSVAPAQPLFDDLGKTARSDNVEAPSPTHSIR